MPHIHVTEAGVNLPFTVANAVFYCGVMEGALFKDNTKSDRMSAELFDDDFLSCMEKTYEEFDEELKSYSNLTVVNGKIRLGPGQKNNTKDFIQWTRDHIPSGINPTLTRFPVVKALDYIKRYKHHEAYIKKSKIITKTAKPGDFMKKVKWIEWYPNLINILRPIPGRSNVPLSNICRPINVTIHANYGYFIDEYVYRSPLTGQAYQTNAAEVHTYICKVHIGKPGSRG